MATAIVFGARNLGRAIAHALHAEGWQIVAVARSASTLERLSRELPEAVGVEADARDERAVRDAFARAAELGPVELVVVSISPRAGASGGGELAGAGAQIFEPYLDDLLPALSTVVRVGGEVLAANGRGTYIQITGGSARRGMAGRGAWASAAFATRGMMQAAASELRERGVHAALLVVDAAIESEKTAERLAGRAAHESASEADVAQAVLYLAGQSERAWTHELVLTPRGDRWVP